MVLIRSRSVGVCSSPSMFIRSVIGLQRIRVAFLGIEARRRYEEGNEEEDEMEDGEQVLETCMERFFYTRCYSSLEFISALKVYNAGLFM